MTSRTTTRWLIGFSAAVCVLGATLHPTTEAEQKDPVTTPTYDPIRVARASIEKTRNHEAAVPPQCYTKTGGESNPCWTCHTAPVDPNYLTDWRLQEEYAFSDVALSNHWTNLFKDRTSAIEKISDEEILSWIRDDNYGPLVAALEALRAQKIYQGWVPDLDFAQGLDEDGFACDGSGWRAIRYKPFLGTFWPTNGSSDDVLIRLPTKFGVDAEGNESREILKVNYAILEAAMCAEPRRSAKLLCRRVEEIDESVAKVDLDGDGEIAGKITEIRGLPRTYVGGARKVRVERYVYPQHVEFFHTVRYVDPDVPSLLSRRMKEVRYSRKVHAVDNWARVHAYEREHEDKDEGLVPIYTGSPLIGLKNKFGWQIQGFIEDADGRLRLQTEEEHKFCMGCHSSIGVTVDSTFASPRKVPGAEGWRHQDLRGIPDVPQAGHRDPEILTYLRRVRGGDEFRANDEMIGKFFDDEGKLLEDKVRRAAVGGDQDIRFLVVPSRERAILLGKAYLALVREQTFDRGRDAVIKPVANVHPSIKNGSTQLNETKKIFRDGKLWLDWPSARCEPRAELKTSDALELETR